VARDEAFNFYYRANLELLEDLGAELCAFSPLRGEPIPEDARMLYVGGGFPETFLDRFRQVEASRTAYRRRIQAGLLTVAECGGYLWLARSLRGTAGDPVPMLGVVEADMAMTPRLIGFGYRTLEAIGGGPFPAGTRFRGHAFHHAEKVADDIRQPAWIERGRGDLTAVEGALGPTWAAGFLHAYWRSNPGAVATLLDRARLTPSRFH